MPRAARCEPLATACAAWPPARPPLAPFADRDFWRAQIARYSRYIAARNEHDVLAAGALAERKGGREAEGAARRSAPFPDPPREVYYVWLTHMLQPSAYQRDCLSAFGRVVPHENHAPRFADGAEGAEAEAAWSAHEPAAAFVAVEWFRAFDGLQQIAAEVAAKAPKIVARDADFIRGAIDNYGKLLSLCLREGSGGSELAPGLILDFTWHSHQTTPLAYNALMAEAGGYVDHNPCGEDNPPDIAWTRNTLAAWAEMLEEEVDPEFFPVSVTGGQCCCAWSPEYTQHRQATELALAAALSSGKARWGRSKLMLVGEGRAGKSALTNALRGREFMETASTAGIEAHEVRIAVDASQAAAWAERRPPESEHAAVLAKLVSAKGKSAAPSAVSASSSAPAVSSESLDAVIKALGDTTLTDARLVFSLFDFGGMYPP